MKNAQNVKQDTPSLDSPKAVVAERERAYLREQRRAERDARATAQRNRSHSTVGARTLGRSP